jgi:hypothetical protein
MSFGRHETIKLLGSLRLKSQSSCREFNRAYIRHEKMTTLCVAKENFKLVANVLMSRHIIKEHSASCILLQIDPVVNYHDLDLKLADDCYSAYCAILALTY